MSKSTFLAIAVLEFGACGSLPPDGSLDRIKHDQRLEVRQQCRANPMQYGFPYTREQLVNVRATMERSAPDLAAYCSHLANVMVK